MSAITKTVSTRSSFKTSAARFLSRLFTRLTDQPETSLASSKHFAKAYPSIAHPTSSATQQGLSSEHQSPGDLSKTLTFEEFQAQRCFIRDRMDSMFAGSASKALGDFMLKADPSNLRHLYNSPLYLALIEKYAV